MDSEREPNEREKELAQQAVSGVSLKGWGIPEFRVKELLDCAAGCMAHLFAIYRAELRPEPTAGDTAEDVVKEIKTLVSMTPRGYAKVLNIVGAALSAARGERKESKYEKEERFHNEIYISDLKTENERLRKEVKALEDAVREVVLQRKNHAVILNKDHDGDFIGALNALAVLTPEVGE